MLHWVRLYLVLHYWYEALCLRVGYEHFIVRYLYYCVFLLDHLP